MSTDFTRYLDLASARLGGAVLAANDEFFAPKENLIQPAAPIWKEGAYTERGKWMDGWESRRRRTPGHDWCLIRLGVPGVLAGVVVDTSYFRGNYPESCSLEACLAPPDASVEELLGPDTRWLPVLPRHRLEGDRHNRFEISSGYRFSHLRLNIFPDGGVARLRVYGLAVPDWAEVRRRGGELDLIAAVNGGRVLDCNDQFFGAATNLLSPGRGVDMHDGWETRRRRDDGHDHVVLQLCHAGRIERVEVDTNHFKGNHPDRCSLDVCDRHHLGGDPEESDWKMLLGERKLQAHSRHFFREELEPTRPATHARFHIYPDGGVSRLRLFGTLTPQGWQDAGLETLNTLLPDTARKRLHDCCGCNEWARRMAEARPLGSLAELLEKADDIWWALGKDEWLEAFQSHPRIGEGKAEEDQSGAASQWSEGEQAGARDASEEVRERLARMNEEYYERFGYIFIVCATGRSAEEMLEILEQRLDNDAYEELEVAAEEQRKITRLRLEKLILFQ